MTNSVQVCTAATLAQLPSARVLGASLRRHHPDADLTVLVLDGETGEHDPSGPRVVSPADVGVPPEELARRAMACSAPELADALTPWLVEYLLDEGAPVVIALSPETEVFAPLRDVVELAGEHGVVVAPRSDSPIPDDGLEPTPAQADAAGPFAPGFVAVSRIGLPAMAPVHVLRDPGCAVSAWNLHQRDLRAAGDGNEVAGRPLRWFDFTDYSPEVPQLLSTGYERPRIRLSGEPALARLCDEHGARLRDAGYRASPPGYGYGALPDGGRIDARMRRIYADALRNAVENGDREPPSPFGTDGADAFAAWINEPVAPPADPLVSRYLARVRDEEPVLRELFSSIAGEGAEAYLGALRDERNPYDIPPWVLPTEDDLVALMWRRWRARPAGPRPRGVNVVGYVTAVVGVGHVARVFASLLDGAGVPEAVVANEETTSEKSLPFDTRRAGDAPYDVNLVCVNADHTPLLAEQLGPDFFAGRRTIGVWAWEVEDFPASSVSAFDLVDEVWVASDFEFEAIAPVASKPVRKHPPPVVVPFAPGVSRTQLGLPDDRFVFLFVYDFLSTAERKNPVGLIEAYTRAFGPDDGTVLVLKSINGDKRVEQLERVRRAAAGRSDVIVRDEYLSPDLHAALLSQCDAYVSLHRSEGFGLDLAAAMGLGKPVIATGYSGNLEFMADDTAFLVDYDLEPVGPGNDPYPADSQWARPRVDHAAELMRRVIEQPDEARERGRRAAASVRAGFSTETRSAALALMVDEARARSGRPGSWRRFFTERWRAERHQDEHLPYGRFWLPDGTPIDRTMRRLLASRDGERAPDPELDLSAFYAWLNEPVFPPALPVVSRYLHELWRDRPDLQSHFPNVDADPRGYLEWLIEYGHADTDVPFQLLPRRDALSSLTRYQERQARRDRLVRVFRTAGRRAAGLVSRR